MKEMEVTHWNFESDLVSSCKCYPKNKERVDTVFQMPTPF